MSFKQEMDKAKKKSRGFIYDEGSDCVKEVNMYFQFKMYKLIRNHNIIIVILTLVYVIAIIIEMYIMIKGI